MAMVHKQCFDCGVLKPRNSKYFYRNKSKKDGLSGQCIDCKKQWRKSQAGKKSLKKARKQYKGTPKGKQTRKHYKDSPEGKKQQQEYRIKADHGISLDDKVWMYILQSGRCAICGDSTALDEVRVDHDHKTGEIRGLLCNRCNLAIGQFEDNTKTLQNAITYLEKHK